MPASLELDSLSLSIPGIIIVTQWKLNPEIEKNNKNHPSNYFSCTIK